jgi:hypothetical protein
MLVTNKTEKQKYRVVLKEGGVEIRYYPAATLATIYSSSKNYKGVANNGFRKLAGYIFGGNEKSESIAMTSPVRMKFSDSGSSMSFIMPEKYNQNSLPKPNDKTIFIEQAAPQYVASISFGGYATDELIQEHQKLLAVFLANKGIKPIGDFSFLGYNAPYQFLARKNDVIVPIDWKE